MEMEVSSGPLSASNATKAALRESRWQMKIERLKREKKAAARKALQDKRVIKNAAKKRQREKVMMHSY
jgi:hypothetical protein